MRQRFRAFGWHLFISSCIALLSAGLVFLCWYPGLIAHASGVQDIYLIVLGVDVILGPAITLVIFNPKTKPKRELTRDLAIVGTIQILALLYGLHTVFIARPAFIVYNAGRFDVTYANEIDDVNLAKAKSNAYATLPLLGPAVVSAALPTDTKARNDLLFDSLSGGADLPKLPQYFTPYLAEKADVIARLQPLTKLADFNPSSPAAVTALVDKYAAAKRNAGFVPLKGKADDLTVVVSRDSGEILEYVRLKPWL